MKIWNLIVQSNTFNFAILVIIFAVIIKKCNLSKALDNAVNKVKDSIEASKTAKENSIEELKKADDMASKLPNEIQEISDNAQKNIEAIEEIIAQEAQNQVEAIKNNTKKVLDAKEKEIVSKLSNKTILASLELAKKHLQNLLQNNPEYHQKFIDDSIKELDKLKQ